MTNSIVMIEISLIRDTDDEILKIGDLDFYISTEILKDYLIKNGYEGLKEIESNLMYLGYKARQQYMKIREEGENNAL